MDYLRKLPLITGPALKVNGCITAEDDFINKLDNLLSTAQDKVTDEVTLLLIEKSIGALKYIHSFAHEYDYKNIPANGYRTIILTGYHALTIGINESIDSDEFIEEFKILMKSHLDGFHYIHKMRSATVNNKSTVIQDNELLFNLFHSYMSRDTESLRPLYSRFAGSMFVSLPGFGRTIAKLIQVSLLTCKSSWSRLLACTFDTETYIYQLDYCIRTMNVTIMKFADIFRQRSLIQNTFKFLSPSTRTHDIHIQPQGKYYLTLSLTNDQQSHVQITEAPMNINQSRKLIRCLSIKSKSTGIYDGCIILFCHGGAFVTSSPEINVHILTHWANEMPGCTIIAPEINNAPDYRFPSQLQQLLDVYLWLTTIATKQQLQSSLGLTSDIKKIILVGESSGAMHIFGLLYVLNDIKNNYNCSNEIKARHSVECINIQMPTSIHVIYPALTMSKSVVPSLLLTPHHFFITPHFCATTALAYAPYHPCVDLNILNKPIYDGYSEGRMRHLFNQTNDDVLDHQYSNALAYQPMESLKSIKLHIAAVKNDIWIDYLIELMKKWQGECTYHVMGDLCHGYMMMPFLGEPYHTAIKVTVDQMKQDFIH